MKKHKYAAAIASLALAASTSHAASVLNLTGDVANSDAGAFGTNFANLLNDSFLYDPSTPTVPLPFQGSNDIITGLWHGNKSSGNHVLSFTLSGGAITTTTGSAILYFDVYGRGGNSPPLILDRDDNYTVTLFNGDYSTQVAQLTGQGVADSAPFFNRSTFNLGTGVTFDRIQITSPAGSGSPNQYFTLAEVRAATAIPEPSTALLGGLGVLGLLRRRRLS